MNNDLSKSPEEFSTETNNDTSTFSSRERAFVCFILLIITLIAYANTLSNDWVWDDVSSVLLHKHVQNPKKIFQLFLEDQHAFGRGQGNFYRPLVSVSFMIDYLLSYKKHEENAPYPVISPILFHITNSLWHAGAVILVFLLLNRLKVPKFVSFWTSIIYAIHPIPTEAVTYISGRADMMSAVFVLAGILSCIHFLKEERQLRQIIYLIGVMLFFVLGLLSKESSNIFPLLILLIILFASHKKTSESQLTKKSVKKWIPFVGSLFITIIYIILRSTVLNFSEKTDTVAKAWNEKVIEIGQSFAFYIRVLLFPFGLHMEQTLENTPYWTAILGYAYLLLFGMVCYWAWKNKQYRMTIAILWFLLNWLPISGLFTLNAPQAEHWMYIPMIGFWWFVTEAILYIINTIPQTYIKESDTKLLLPAVNIFLIAISLMYFSLTFLRNQDWKDNETIFRSTLYYNPNTIRVRYNLAVTYEEIIQNYPGAKREYQELLKLYDRMKKKSGISEKQISFVNEQEIETWLSYGKTLFHLGKFAEAIEYLTPVSVLIKQKEFIPYSIEALWYIAQSSIAMGDIKTYQFISSKIQTTDEKLLKEIQKITLGCKLSIPSYMPVYN